MKRIFKKALWIGIPAASIGTVIGLCTAFIQPVPVSRTTYYQVFNAPFSTSPYQFDNSTGYGTNSNPNHNFNTTNIAVALFRQESIGSPIFNAAKTSDQVIQPSYTFVRMEYADSMTVTGKYMINKDGVWISPDANTTIDLPTSFTFTRKATNDLPNSYFVGANQKFNPPGSTVDKDGYYNVTENGQKKSFYLTSLQNSSTPLIPGSKDALNTSSQWITEKDPTFGKLSNEEITNLSLNQPIFQNILTNGSSIKNIFGNDINISTSYDNLIWVPTSLNIKVMPGQYWSTQKDAKTNYEINGNDFYYSFVRTWLLTGSDRNSILGGGSKEIDNAVIKNFNVTTRYQVTDNYPNGYVLTGNNINVGQLNPDGEAIIGTKGSAADQSLLGIAYDAAKTAYTSKTIQKRNNFVINSTFQNDTQDEQTVNTTTNFYSFFQGSLINNGLFSAAPSSYIQQSLFTPRVEKEYKDYKLNPDTLSGLFNIYFYALNADQTLFAGSYVPIEISNETQSIVWIKNVNYVDHEWVENNNTVKKLIQIWNASTNSDIFTQSMVTQYLNGNVSSLTYTNLSQAVQNNFLNKNDFRWANVNVSNNVLVRTLPVTAPFPSGKGEEKEYQFNNVFSQLVYGASLAQLATGEMAQSGSENYYAGFGLRFRSLIRAAINWYSYANTMSNGESIPWISELSPDNLIGGDSKNQDQTLRDVWQDSNVENKSDQVNGPNNVYILKTNANGQYESVPNSEVPWDQQNTYYENFQIYNNPKNAGDPLTLFSSAQYNEIKAQMAILIKEFYKKYPDLKGQKIEWKLNWGYTTLQTVAQQNAYQSVIQVINSLNPNIKVSLNVATTVNGLIQAIANGFSTSQFTGWTYDYNGIGTGMQFLLTTSQATTSLPAFAIFANLATDSSLTTYFPIFIKLSKYIEQRYNEYNAKNGLTAMAMPFKDWANLTNAQRKYVIMPVLNSSNPSIENPLYYKVYESKQQSLIDAVPNMQTLFQIWFQDFQKQTSNIDLVKLTQEMNTLIGSSMEMGGTGSNVLLIPNKKISYQILQKWFSNPIVNVGTLYLQDVYVSPNELINNYE